MHPQQGVELSSLSATSLILAAIGFLPSHGAAETCNYQKVKSQPLSKVLFLVEHPGFFVGQTGHQP